MTPSASDERCTRDELNRASGGGRRQGHVLLVGFMGSGKSTVGKIVSRAMRLPLVDTDSLVEERCGRAVSQVFAEEGEDVFRRLESDVLASLASVGPSVVACGGGVVLRSDNREMLKSLGDVVYLEVSAPEALARIGDVSRRPLLAAGGVESAARLHAEREGLYRQVANAVVRTGGKTRDTVAAEVVAAVAALDAARCAS